MTTSAGRQNNTYDTMANVVRTTFFGTSSIYLASGTTSIFIDAFLTRPSLSTLQTSLIGPDKDTIRRILSIAAIKHLDALFVAHSHFDHAMDAPDVIKRLGGTLYGSESTLMIARGADVPEE